ncbi:MAG: type IV pilus assembly protein PilM [Candidatus Sumerlaeia bacterium]
MLFKPRTPIGLDIGSSTVKALQMRQTSRGVVLERFGMAEIFPSGQKKKDPEAVRQAKVQAIKKALAAGGFNTTQAVTSVSGESIIVRYIQLPSMPEEELKNALRWEAEEYIPFPIDEVNIDSAILGHTADGSKVDVLLVSARKDHVQQHVDLLQQAGLQPVVIDVDAFAFMNCFEYNHEPSPNDVIGLINIGAEVTSINIYMGGASRFSRDVPIAGDAITHAIQSRLNHEFHEADSLKVRVGLPEPALSGDGSQEGLKERSLIETIRGTMDKLSGQDLVEDTPDAIAAKVIKNTVNSLINEIKRSIQFFENQAGGVEVKRLVIGGGTAKLKNIAPFMQAELNLPVEFIDPLRRVGIESKNVNQSQLMDNRHLIGVGVGLALRRVID